MYHFCWYNKVVNEFGGETALLLRQYTTRAGVCLDNPCVGMQTASRVFSFSTRKNENSIWAHALYEANVCFRLSTVHASRRYAALHSTTLVYLPTKRSGVGDTSRLHRLRQVNLRFSLWVENVFVGGRIGISVSHAIIWNFKPNNDISEGIAMVRNERV